MSDLNMTLLQSALDQRRRGFSLPQPLYTDDEIFEAELEGIFANDWLFACNSCEIRQPGDFTTLEIGRDSLIIVRGKDGELRAFHNTCRHRGSRICLTEKGNTRRFVCPYHQWTYELDGRLFRARQMPPDFDGSEYGLKPARIEVICGLVYVSLGKDPPSLERYRQAVTPYIAPHRPDKTRVAFVSTLIEEANWKVVIENNRECYHCASTHPELMATLFDFALPADATPDTAAGQMMARSATRWDALGLPHKPAEGGNEFRCIRLPFKDGRTSFSPDGTPACSRLLGTFTEPDPGSVRMFRVPNNWHHFLADHIIHFRLLPLSANRTALRTTWLVHEDAVPGVDYNIERLTAVWSATNDQDRMLAENNHRGIRSRAYAPGPYSPQEFMLNDFADWYVGKMQAFANGPPGPAAGLLPVGLMRSDREIGSPVANAAYSPQADSLPAPPFSGTIVIAQARMQTAPVLDKPVIRDRDARLFPQVTLQFVSIGNILAPLERGEMVKEPGELPSHSYWRVIPQFGRIWREKGDGEWSRAAFPLMLVNDTENHAHQGLATFLYRDGVVTGLRYQFIQQTTPYLIPQHFVAWGMSRLTMQDSLQGQEAKHSLEATRAAITAELADRIPSRPWSELVRSAPADALDGFGAPLASKWVVMTAIVRNGTLYYSESATPYGPYPYPLEMRFGPRSVMKSIGVPLALLRLAQVYGPDVLNLKIGDYVKVSDPKYHRVRFIDAANMATGMGGAGSLKTHPNDIGDGYIDPYYDDWYLAPSQADKLQEIDAHNLPYPWDPGTVMRYRDHDFYLLGAALDGYLQSVRGPDADIWNMLRTEVFAPIGIHHAPVVRTREPGGRDGLAWFCAGYYPTVDDLAKIAMLFQDGGAHGGRQILQRELTAKLFSTDQVIRQNSNMAVDSALPPADQPSEELLYKMGFHFYPYVSERIGKRIHVPTMRGSTGNLISLYPNHVVSMRLTKAWPLPKEEQDSELPATQMMSAIDRIAPF